MHFDAPVSLLLSPTASSRDDLSRCHSGASILQRQHFREACRSGPRSVKPARLLNFEWKCVSRRFPTCRKCALRAPWQAGHERAYEVVGLPHTYCLFSLNVAKVKTATVCNDCNPWFRANFTLDFNDPWQMCRIQVMHAKPAENQDVMSADGRGPSSKDGVITPRVDDLEDISIGTAVIPVGEIVNWNGVTQHTDENGNVKWLAKCRPSAAAEALYRNCKGWPRTLLAGDKMEAKDNGGKWCAATVMEDWKAPTTVAWTANHQLLGLHSRVDPFLPHPPLKPKQSTRKMNHGSADASEADEAREKTGQSSVRSPLKLHAEVKLHNEASPVAASVAVHGSHGHSARSSFEGGREADEVKIPLDNQVSVLIVKAQNVIASDTNGLSDPFCEVLVLTVALYDCDGNKSFTMKQLQKEYIGSVDIDLAAEIAANEQTEKWYTITWNPKLRIREEIGRPQAELEGETFGEILLRVEMYRRYDEISNNQISSFSTPKEAAIAFDNTFDPPDNLTWGYHGRPEHSVPQDADAYTSSPLNVFCHQKSGLFSRFKKRLRTSITNKP